MTKKKNQTYSHYALEALSLLANIIKTTRIEKAITTQELSDRANISRGLLRRIEKGDPSCSIGCFLEVASILGIALFNKDNDELTKENKRMEHTLVLLPSKVHKPTIELDDDF
tara:strand:- start:1227 stop:1565 length:339 start_codon:yes stop_codon:yes gene_type:complete